MNPSTNSEVAAGSQKTITLDNARNLVDLLLMNRATPDRIAATVKVNGAWEHLTWSAILSRVHNLAAGLHEMGIRKGDVVAIFSDTRLEWVLSAMAIFSAGASVAPIYSSDTPAEIAYIMQDSGAKAIIIDHDRPDTKHKMPGRLARVREVAEKIPDLKSTIIIEAPSDSQGVSLLTDVERMGAAKLASDDELKNLMMDSADAIKGDDIAFLLYTSGTTGLPKGVMLTHSNWVAQGRTVARNGLVRHDEKVLLFLPLAHAFALIAFIAHLSIGLELIYAESIDKAVDNACETKATLLLCVPRVLEKAYNKIVSQGASKPGIKGQMFRWAMGLFDEYAASVAAGKEYNSLQWKLAKQLVFSQVETQIHARFGVALKTLVSGGAPLSKKIAVFFELCGFNNCEGYGLTETCAPTHCNLPIDGKHKVGTVGVPFGPLQVRIAEDGEILMKGPQIMKGYFKNPEATAAAIDSDGWFHSGDIGIVDADGFLSITDRKKDLLKTSGGKYVAPQELETGLKTEPLVNEVCIIGDKRKFVSALITLAPDAVESMVKKDNLPGSTMEEWAKLPEVQKRIDQAVKVLNDKLPSYATIKKFAVLDHQWTQADGLITPTLKVKRKEIVKRYADLIDGFYGGERFD